MFFPFLLVLCGKSRCRGKPLLYRKHAIIYYNLIWIGKSLEQWSIIILIWGNILQLIVIIWQQEIKNLNPKPGRLIKLSIWSTSSSCSHFSLVLMNFVQYIYLCLNALEMKDLLKIIYQSLVLFIGKLYQKIDSYICDRWKRKKWFEFDPKHYCFLCFPPEL